jgi:multidrug efflux pump subunit AcrA (membrane-fusion protein)
VLAECRPALDQPRLRSCALALASTLAFRLRIERVSIGVRCAGRVQLLAVSDAPDLARRAALASALEAAMAEAVDHGAPVLHGGSGSDLEAHRLLAAHGGARQLYSVPVGRGGGSVAVLVFERLSDEAFGAATIAACNALAAALAPALELKRRDQAPVFARWLRRGARSTFLLAFLAGAGVLSTIDMDYRVSAPARVEGRVQRVVVAPFDGYVDTAPVRAGDRVMAGQLLATLQDSALLLERGTQAAERDELAKQYRRALGMRDRAEARVLEARIAQTQAKLDLLDARLARTRLEAPFDGVVISGDLSRSLGAPVERGQVLFEVAPLDGHRIVLQADERDVGELAPGMQGTLALAALPDATLGFTLARVGSVAQTETGQAVFRVEGRLEGDVPALRPGMEGVAKVAVERRSALWILSHRLVEWVQLTAWTLLP